VELGVDGATYDSFGDEKLITVPDGSNYSAVLRGLQDGSFTLDVRRYQGETLDGAMAYEAVPISKDAEARVSLAGVDANVPLQIDDDLDGVVDRTVTVAGRAAGRARVIMTTPGENAVLRTRFVQMVRKRHIRGRLRLVVSASDGSGQKLLRVWRAKVSDLQVVDMHTLRVLGRCSVKRLGDQTAAPGYSFVLTLHDEVAADEVGLQVMGPGGSIYDVTGKPQSGDVQVVVN
jgi:hypothetical protein